jgi:hypothetical protein
MQVTHDEEEEVKMNGKNSRKSHEKKITKRKKIPETKVSTKNSKSKS